ncbi:putative thioredoxin [Cryptosporidium felis]|nr:putative thioredoxin [Cryptosporidium felis]
MKRNRSFLGGNLIEKWVFICLGALIFLRLVACEEFQVSNSTESNSGEGSRDSTGTKTILGMGSPITISNGDYSGQKDHEHLINHPKLELQLTTAPQKIIQNLTRESGSFVSEVIQLSLEDLENFKKKDSVVLFYVPWCVFCREIIPEFEKAAAFFKGKNIKFGKIDSNEHRRAVIMEQIIKFPTIKIYTEGQSRFYGGLSNTVSIVNFVNSEFNRDLLISTSDLLKVFMGTDNNSIKVIAVVDHEESPEKLNSILPYSSSSVSDTYLKISRKYHNTYFGHILSNDTQVLKSLREFHYNYYFKNNSNPSLKKKSLEEIPLLVENTLVLTTPWNEDENEDEEEEVSSAIQDNNDLSNNDDLYHMKQRHGFISLDKIDFNDFGLLDNIISKYQYPPVINFNPLIAQRLFSSEKPIAFLFIEKQKVSKNDYYKTLRRFRILANRFRGEIMFVRSGITLPHEKRISQIMINEENSNNAPLLPCISVLSFQNNNKNTQGKVINPIMPPNMPPIRPPQIPLVYKSSISGPKLLEDSNLEHFIEDFVSGRLKPYFKSEEPPLEEDNTGPVRVVVSKTFQKEVLDPNIDVLIVFYAPWCGHCRKLEPDYNSLAQRLRGISDKLKIAKIDGSQNEVENIQVIGYPTILLFKFGAKFDPILYNGDRSVHHMIEWLSQKVSFSFDYHQYLNPELAFEDDDLDMALSHEL